MIFAFSLIIEGNTEKILQSIMPVKSIYTKTLVLFNKKVFLNTAERFKQKKIIDIIFAMKIFFSGNLFRAAPYRLMLELHKDALFHYTSLKELVSDKHSNLFCIIASKEEENYYNFDTNQIFSKKRKYLKHDFNTTLK
jgi:hypothetical protein